VPIVGAAAVHGVLSDWRRRLNGSPAAEKAEALDAVAP
jgi:hypothetical protein